MGKIVKTVPVVNETTVVTSPSVQGIYLFRVMGNDGTQEFKVIVK
jgi:hypothetical protein